MSTLSLQGPKRLPPAAHLAARPPVLPALPFPALYVWNHTTRTIVWTPHCKDPALRLSLCVRPATPPPHRVLVNKSGLPGSNGSGTRADITAAGLIVVLIGNYLQIVLAALYDVEDKAEGHAAPVKVVV